MSAVQVQESGTLYLLEHLPHLGSDLITPTRHARMCLRCRGGLDYVINFNALC
jgi:hypothetical protein